MENSVIVVRHGDKDTKNLITTLGAAEMFAIAKSLSIRFHFGAIIHSGEVRTNQGAIIAYSALMPESDLAISEHWGFNFKNPFQSAFGNDDAAFTAERKSINAAGGTMAIALEKSQYAQMGRKQLSKAVVETAYLAGSSILVISHSPYASFAVPSPNLSLPYDIGTGDAIVYTVKDDAIIEAELIVNPTRA